jgi:hypothetical protein
MTSVPDDDLAPLTIPHLYWKCTVTGLADDFLIVIDVLIDHSVHTVLISDHFAKSLCLKRRKLYETMAVEMAIPREGKKRMVQMTKWVKLKLYDPSGLWSSRTVRAVVAPSLCSPVILCRITFPRT